MSPTKLFSLNYLFDVYPGSSFYYMLPLIIFFLILILGSFYLEKIIKGLPYRVSLQRVLPHFSGKIRFLGILGFVFLWVRYENLPYLAMRFFLLVYLLYIGWVIGFSIYKYKKVLPVVLKHEHQQKNRKNYLPQAKKKTKKKR